MSKELEDIFTSLCHPTIEKTWETLASAMNLIEQTFPSMNSSFLEFIQNSDDAKSTKIRFEISPEYLQIWNDGRIFDKKDIQGICDVGNSKKKSGEFIGYFGVGFKSVFLISSHVEIQSGDRYFSFNKNAHENPDRTPWQILPIRSSEPYFEIPEGFTTGFRIYWKDPNQNVHFKKYLEFLKSEILNSRLLLFLRSISDLEIVGKGIDKFSIKFHKEIITESLINQDIMDIVSISKFQDSEKNSIPEEFIYGIAEKLIDIEDDVRNDHFTIDRKRHLISKRKIQIAVMMNEKYIPCPLDQGSLHMGVYSFLPLKDQNVSIRFIIHGDFITNPGRSSIEKDALWNDFMLKQLLKLTKETIKGWMKVEDWKYSIPEIFYTSERNYRDYVCQKFQDPLNEYIKSAPIFFTIEGREAKKNDLFQIPEYLVPYLGKIDKLRVISPKYSLDILQNLGIVDNRISFSEDESISNQCYKFLGHIAEDHNIDFFKAFYTHELLENKKSIKNIPVLTDSWDVRRSFSEVDVYLDKRTKYHGPIDKIEFLHEDLKQDSKICSYLEEQDFPQLTDQDAEEFEADYIELVELKKLNEDWELLKEKEDPIQTTIKLFKRIDSKELDCWKYRFMTFLTTNGKWKSAENILFSSEYNPKNHNLESLINSGKIAFEKPTMEKIHFLSPKYLEYLDGFEIGKFKEIMINLGCEKLMDTFNNTLVQSIGVQIAKAYEFSHGRKNSRLLSKDKEDQLHYDMESEDRKIEIKGRSNTNYRIELTPLEYSACSKNEKNYYLYLTVNALISPILYIIQGSKLIELFPYTNVSFSFSDLEKGAIDKFNLTQI